MRNIKGDQHLYYLVSETENAFMYLKNKLNPLRDFQIFKRFAFSKCTNSLVWYTIKYN